MQHFFGGGTIFSEYELLTQNDLSNLCRWYVPYNYLGKENLDKSIVSYFNDLNYKTVSYHPYFSTGYNRKNAYKFYNFDKSIFLDDIDYNFDKSYSLNYAYGIFSDSITYNSFYDEMNNKRDDENLFQFIITMQNHSPYDNNSLHDELINFVDYDNELNIYLNRLNLSDKALKELINYIDNSDEKICLVFLGDHQPHVKVLEELELTSEYEEDEAYNYVIPYFVYSNFKMERKINKKTNIEFISSQVLDMLEMPLTIRQKYLLDFQKSIPYFNYNYYVTNNYEKRYIDVLDDNNKYDILFKDFSDVNNGLIFK